MTRLTLVVPNGDIWLLDNSGNPSALVTENDDCHKYVKKLAEYEDLDEKGLLIKIPCKIGDTIYVIPSEVNYKINIVNRHRERNRVYKQIVSGVTPGKRGYIIYTCDNQSIEIEEIYRETWFLTEEEAQVALREMEDKYETD